MNNSQKVQKAKVGVAGSFFNQMMSNNATLPIVGKGATQMHYTDRSCFEVIEVSKDGKTARLESLTASADKTQQGGHGHQNWIFTPSGYFMTVQWRHNAWRQKGQRVMFTDKYAETLGAGFHGSDDYNKVYIDGKMVVVEGITELITEWHKIKIIFGVKDFHYDWSF